MKYLTILSICFLQWKFLLVEPQSVFTIVGDGTPGNNDGQGTSARINQPSACIPDGKGNFFILEQFGYRVRKMNASFYVSSWVGNGAVARVDGQTTRAGIYPFHGVYDSTNDNLLVGDLNGGIRSITKTGHVSTIAGSTSYRPYGLVLDSNSFLFFTDSNSGNVRKMTLNGSVGTFSSTTFSNPYGITVDASNNLYVTEFGSNTVKKITPGAVSSTFATGFSWPQDIAWSKLSNELFVANPNAQNIKKITMSGVVSTYAGSGTKSSADGVGVAASFNDPIGINIDTFGNLYVADRGNNRIRKICNDTCPSGYWFTATALCCVPCPAGTYQPNGGKTSCLPCPENAFCTTSTRFDCQVGYQFDPTGNKCDSCPDGTYKSVTSLDACQPCPGNAVCTTISFLCLPGYQLDTTGSDCIVCPDGTYKNHAGLDACQPCSPDTFCGSTGIQSPSIYSINPMNGFQTTGNENLEILGENFNTCQGAVCNIEVKINGKLCTNIIIKDSRMLTCKTPPGFGGNLNVSVRINSTEVVKPGLFSYKKPEITSLQPDFAISSGEEVVVSCKECGSDPLLVVIQFFKSDSNDTCTCQKVSSRSSGFGCFTPISMVKGIYRVVMFVAGQASETLVTYRLGIPLTTPITKNIIVSTFRNQQVSVIFSLITRTSETVQFEIISLPSSGDLFQYDSTAINLRGPLITKSMKLPSQVLSVIFNPAIGFVGKTEFIYQGIDIDAVSNTSSVTIDVLYRHLPPEIQEKVKTVNLELNSIIQPIDFNAICFENDCDLELVFENQVSRGHWFLDADGTQRLDLIQNGTYLAFPPSKQQVDSENKNKRTVQLYLKHDNGGGVFKYAQLYYHFRDGTRNRSVDSGQLNIQIQCPSSQYVNSWSQGAPCKACPVGAKCSGIGSFLPYNMLGFYPSTDFTFLPCVPSDACPEGTPSSFLNDNSSQAFLCKEGYTGERCGQCSTGYYKNAMSCLKCPTYSIHPALLVFILLFILIILFFLLNLIRKIDLGFIGILIAFCQSIAIFQTFPLRWPVPVARLFHYFSFFYFNVELTSPECFVANDFSKAYELKWYGTMVLPLVVLAVLIILVALEFLYRWIKKLLFRYLSWVKRVFIPFTTLSLKVTNVHLAVIQKTVPPMNDNQLEIIATAPTYSTEIKPANKSTIQDPSEQTDTDTMNARSHSIVHSRRLSSRQPLLRASPTKLGTHSHYRNSRGDSSSSLYRTPFHHGNAMIWTPQSNSELCYNPAELCAVSDGDLTPPSLVRQIGMSHILSGYYYETPTTADHETSLGGGPVPFVVTVGGIYLTVLKFMYINLSLRSLELFDCNPTPIPNYSIYQPESSRQCFDTWWYTMLPYSLLGILLYVLGIPGLFLVLYVKRTYYLRIPWKKRTPSQQFILQLTYKRTNEFRDGVRYWDMVLMARQLSVIVCQLFLTNYIAMQTQLVMMVHVQFLYLHARQWPYTLHTLNRLEAMSELSTILILMAGIMFYFQEANQTEMGLTLLGYGVVSVIVGTVCVILVVLMHHLRVLFMQYQQMKKHQQTRNLQ